MWNVDVDVKRWFVDVDVDVDVNVDAYVDMHVGV